MNQRTILRSVLIAVLSLVATTATAHDFEVKGIYYNYNDDGTVSVTFKGSRYSDYADEYTGDVVIPSSVTYSGTTYSVTSIGDEAFRGCSGLTSVTIGNSVTSIGDYAFKSCSGLINVTIPNSVTSIGSHAFHDCSGLTRVDISRLEAWLGIKFDAYYSNPLSYAHHLYLNGEEVKDLVIPNSVTSIGHAAFSGCSGLTSVTIPKSVTSIGREAFYSCSGLTSVTIPNSVTSIGFGAFKCCSGLTSVTIPNSVTSIGDCAFYGCSGLTRVDISSIEAWLGIKFSNYDANPLYYAHLYLNGEEVKDLVIPNSVTSIGKWAFAYCSGLTTVTIPNTVTTIGEWAFSNCRNLTSVTIPNSVTSIGEASFENCINLASITIPNSVTSINYCVFAGCRGLTTVTIPNTVTTIGESAFSDCRNLTSVTIPNSVKNISNYAFYYCSGLTSVTIGNSVNWIGEWAFHRCSSLNSIIIGKSVEYIGDLAFYDYDDKCSASIIIKAVTPPSCGQNLFSSKTYKNPIIVPSIAKEAYQAASVWGGFSNYAETDNKITAIAINNNEANLVINNTLQLSATVTPEDATFADVLQWTSSNPEVATVDDNGLVTAIAKGDAEIIATTCDGSNLSASCTIKVAVPTAHNFEVGGIYYKFNGKGTVEVTFKGSSYDEYADEYTGDVVIPSSVTYSGTEYSVTSIGERAFYSCSGLATISIGNSVTSIGVCAFQDCSSLTSIDIPNSVTSIGRAAFQGCSGLTTISIGNSVTSIGSEAFKGCSKITRVDISSIKAWLEIKFTYFESNPLYYAHHLYLNGEEVKDLVIPNSVTSICAFAFSGLSSLTSVTIPNSITSIGRDAFSNCTGLTSITIPNSVTLIDYGAFYDCSGLTNVTIPNSVTSIGGYAFSGCSGLSSIIIPNSVTTMGDGAFSTSGLTSITIPNSITSIGFAVFMGCSKLTSVTIPNSVTTIGRSSFRRCTELKNITIPNSVTEIGGYAFYGCSGLTSVISKAVTPPTCGSDAFSTETYSVPLIVPSVAKEEYKAASIWSNFSNYAEPERKITAIEFGASTFGVENGETLQLTATVTPEDATFADVLQWTSSNEDVATVDGNGVVTAIAAGTATITAQTVDGSKLTATCVVTVGTGAVEGVETNAARIYSANGNIIIAAAEDGEAAVYDFTGRLIKSVPVVAGDNTAVPVMPGYYIVRTSVKAQSVIVK